MHVRPSSKGQFGDMMNVKDYGNEGMLFIMITL